VLFSSMYVYTFYNVTPIGHLNNIIVCFSGHALVFKLIKTPLLLILSQEKWLKRIFKALKDSMFTGLRVWKDFMYERTSFMKLLQKWIKLQVWKDFMYESTPKFIILYSSCIKGLHVWKCYKNERTPFTKGFHVRKDTLYERTPSMKGLHKWKDSVYERTPCMKGLHV